jgi:uncharacterized protein (AIM24 family)
MSRHPLIDFVRRSAQQDRGQGLFELENDRVLEVNLNGHVWTKTGSMIAHMGGVRFTREGILEHGIGRLFMRTVSGEGTQLTKAEGSGKLYLADNAKKINILAMHNEAIFVNGNDVLAFEPTLKWDVKLMRRVAGILGGGLFNMRFEGTGMLAISTHFDPLTLEVKPGQPVFTDPNATVAWSASLEPAIHTDMSLKTFLGRGSGESIQLRFEGSGFVVVQPKEESYLDDSSSAG